MDTEWKDVKVAVRYMTEKMELSPKFITYSSDAKVRTADEIYSMRPNYGTNFEQAFIAIKNFVNELPPKSHTNIVFMTDGHNNEGNYKSGKEMLSIYLKNCRRTSCVHSIGFSSGHDRKMLEEIIELGTSKGVYRYAKSGDLDQKFSELFDFISLSKKFTISIGTSSPLIVDSNLMPLSNKIIVDLILKKEEYDKDGTIFKENQSTTIKIEGKEISLPWHSNDLFFELRILEEKEIKSQSDLDKAYKKLHYSMDPGKVAKAKRKEFFELKEIVREKFDKFQAIFAEISRGLIFGENATAQLNSLRHETKFSKARRARDMDKRATSNIDKFLDITDELEALPTPNYSELEKLSLSCEISNSSLTELMKESKGNILVFPMRISRPESSIDAPTLIMIEKFCVGKYSFEAFKDSIRFAVNQSGSQKALGGFTGNRQTLDDEFGVVRGSDGTLSNACLPLYLHEDHWKRVDIQIEALIGYFFTMDPLGYKGDQLIALYMILANMIVSRENEESGMTGEYWDWLIDDFTKLCKAIYPKVEKYLREGRFSGRIRGNLLEEFVNDPLNRTKDSINLSVLLGLNHCQNIRDKNINAFDFAFVEESWRRSFSEMFKGQPKNLLDEWMEKLLFADSPSSFSNETLITTTQSGNTNKLENNAFAEFAKAKLNLLSKAATQTALQSPLLKRESAGMKSEYTPRSLAKFEEHEEFYQLLIDQILSEIQSRGGFWSKLFGGALVGRNLPLKAKWLIMIQSLKYSSNSLMKKALERGEYRNTYHYFYDSEGLALPLSSVDEAGFLDAIYQGFENTRKNNWNSLVEKQKNYLFAKKIALSPDLFSFTGRILSECPTRGGEVFDNLVGILGLGSVDLVKIPLLFEKIKVILVGKVSFVKDGPDYDVISKGFSWSQCPLNTANLLRSVVTDDEWVKIENSMYGVSGWVYRESDIPNRHGHCNSNPNSLLTTTFKGFSLGKRNNSSNL